LLLLLFLILEVIVIRNRALNILCSKLPGLVLAVCIGFISPNVNAQDSIEVRRPTVALVLAGGGALGLAHIGVIKVIEELGIPIDIVVGTSLGALIGGFYAQGFDAARLEDLASKIDWAEILVEQVKSIEERYRSRIRRSQYFVAIDFDQRGFKIPGSLLSGRKLLYHLDRLTISTDSFIDFDTMPRRYRAIATDLATGSRVVIDRGSLADVMRASMGIPGILVPYLIGDQYLVDGGIVDNLPVDTARQLGADLIIAVDLIGGMTFSPEKFDRNPLDALYRTIDIMVRSNVNIQLPGADIVISVDLTGYQMNEFGAGKKIMQIGEDTARRHLSALEIFRSELGILTSTEGSVEPFSQSAVQQVIVSGGNKTDRAAAYLLFAPVIGTIPDEKLLERAVADLESLGLYEYIRIRRTEEDSIPTLSVILKRQMVASHSVHAGVEYASTYSTAAESRLGLTVGLVFRNLLTGGSLLSVNIRLLDSAAIQASFVHPLGSKFFAELYMEASQHLNYSSSNLDVKYLYNTTFLEFGIGFGVNPLRWMELSLGLSYQWIESDLIPDIVAGSQVTYGLMGHAFFAMHHLDYSVYPTEGLKLEIQYDISLLAMKNSRMFHTLIGEGLFLPRLDSPFSVAAWAKFGSDFSRQAGDSTAAPQFYKPDISSRQFYPGALHLTESVGSHVIGLGSEFKFQLKSSSQAVGLASFLLSQLSVKAIMQDFVDIQRIFDCTHLNLSVGLGTRFNDGFGVSTRIGVLRTAHGNFRSFFAIDLGSFMN